MGWDWRRDGVTLQLHCFGDVLLTSFPKTGSQISTVLTGGKAEARE